MKPRVLAALTLLGSALLAGVIWTNLAFAEDPKPDATRKIQVDVDIYGAGDNKDSRYHVPVENGKVEIIDLAHARQIAASDGTAAFRTSDNRAGGRTVRFFVKGPKQTVEYIDLNGDGVLDAMVVAPGDKPFIFVDGKWVEVLPLKTDFSLDDRRATVIEPPVLYKFDGSAWIKD